MKTKSEEIELLQQFTRAASESGAGYLHDALLELAQPFEAAVASDYPGEMAVRNLIDQARDLRNDITALREEIQDFLCVRDDLRRQIERDEERARSSRERLDDLRTEAQRIADTI
jgi:chromosome segregation ATPase